MDPGSLHFTFTKGSEWHSRSEPRIITWASSITLATSTPLTLTQHVNGELCDRDQTLSKLATTELPELLVATEAAASRDLAAINCQSRRLLTRPLS